MLRDDFESEKGTGGGGGGRGIPLLSVAGVEVIDGGLCSFSEQNNVHTCTCVSGKSPAFEGKSIYILVEGYSHYLIVQS